MWADSLLAPPVYIDGWATPWYRFLRPLLYVIPGLPARMKIEEEDPFGIKNEQLRAIVKAKFQRGENFHYQWVPLECIRQVDRLRAMVMKAASRIRCPTLVAHAREDEPTSLRSANFMVESIGEALPRMVILEDSYHMVCVDNDREIVANNILEFLGAALPGAGSALANEPRMTADELVAAPKTALATLGRRAREFTRAGHCRFHLGASRHQRRRRRARRQRVRKLCFTLQRARQRAFYRLRHAGFQSRRGARAGVARLRATSRLGWNRPVRCCLRSTPASS